jgi:hypothetical protein
MLIAICTGETDPAEINIASVQASSTLYSDDDRYTADNLIDGTLKAWSEGEEGSGIGEHITMRLNAEVTISSFYIYNGIPQDFYENNRVKILVVNDQHVQLENRNGLQKVTLPQPVTDSVLTFVIEQVYPGDIWDDTCITEICIEDKELKAVSEQSAEYAELDREPESESGNDQVEAGLELLADIPSQWINLVYDDLWDSETGDIIGQELLRPFYSHECYVDITIYLSENEYSDQPCLVYSLEISDEIVSIKYITGVEQAPLDGGMNNPLLIHTVDDEGSEETILFYYYAGEHEPLAYFGDLSFSQQVFYIDGSHSEEYDFDEPYGD